MFESHCLMDTLPCPLWKPPGSPDLMKMAWSEVKESWIVALAPSGYVYSCRTFGPLSPQYFGSEMGAWHPAPWFTGSSECEMRSERQSISAKWRMLWKTCDYPLQIPTPPLINHVHLSEFPPLWVSAFTFLLLFSNLIGLGFFFSAFSFNTGENQIWWSLRSDILESAFAVPTLSLLYVVWSYLTVSLNKWAGILSGRCHFCMNALQMSVWNIIERNVYVSTWSW